MKPTRTATRAPAEGGAGKRTKKRRKVSPAEVKRQLRCLVAATEFYVSQLDELMKRPVTDRREFGRRLAFAINELDFANQRADSVDSA